MAWTDQLNSQKITLIAVAPAADSLNSFSDIGTAISYELTYYGDALAVTETSTSVPITVTPSADPLNAWNDQLAKDYRAFYQLSPTTDSLNAWNDTVDRRGILQAAPTADSLNTWVDDRTVDRRGLYKVTPATDTMSMGDANPSGFRTIATSPTTDTLNAWADSRAVDLRGALTISPTTDSMSMADSLDGFEAKNAAKLHALSAFGAQWVEDTIYPLGTTAYNLDSYYLAIGNSGGDIDKEPGVGEHWTDAWQLSQTTLDSLKGFLTLAVAKSDSMTMADSIAGFRTEAVSASDSMAMSDSYMVNTGTGAIQVQATDSLNSWSDIGTAIRYDLNYYGDSVATSQTIGAGINVGFTDSMTMSDVIPTIYGDIETSIDGETLAAWNDSLATSVSTQVPLTVAPPADSMSMADSRTVFRTIAATHSDSLNTWADSTKGLLTHSASQSDTLYGWNDSLSIGASGKIELNIPADSMTMTDGDSIIYGRLVSKSDDLNGWADNLKAPSVTPIPVALLDSNKKWLVVGSGSL